MIKVYFDDKFVGSVISNHRMTDEEILEYAGVKFNQSNGCFEYDGYDDLSTEDFNIVFD